MGYNQIKNTVVPPAKRTAQTAQKLLAKLPNTPAIISIGGPIVASLLQQTLTYPLKFILQNPVPFLTGSGAAVPIGSAALAAGAMFLGGPAVVIVLAAAGVGAIITYAVIAAAILAVIHVALAAVTIYDQRVALAKAVVTILEAL